MTLVVLETAPERICQPTIQSTHICGQTCFTTIPPRECAIKIRGRLTSYSNVNMFYRTSSPVLYLRLLSFVHQADQQAFGMINHLRCGLSECGVSVVAKGHDAGIRDMQRQVIFQPECLRFRVCPGRNRVATESVHGHDARERLRSAEKTQD